MNLNEVICVVVKWITFTVLSMLDTCRHKYEIFCFLRVKLVDHLINCQFVSSSVNQTI